MTTAKNMRIWLDKEKKRLSKRMQEGDPTSQEANSLYGSMMTIDKVISYLASITPKEEQGAVGIGTETKSLYCAFHPKQVNSFCELCMIEAQQAIFEIVLKELRNHQSHCQECADDNIEMAVGIIENMKIRKVKD